MRIIITFILATYLIIVNMDDHNEEQCIISMILIKITINVLNPIGAHNMCIYLYTHTYIYKVCLHMRDIFRVQ